MARAWHARSVCLSASHLSFCPSEPPSEPPCLATMGHHESPADVRLPRRLFGLRVPRFDGPHVEIETGSPSPRGQGVVQRGDQVSLRVEVTGVGLDRNGGVMLALPKGSGSCSRPRRRRVSGREKGK